MKDKLKPVYVLHGGNVRSQYDGQVHFVRGDHLIGLYRLTPADCWVSINGSIPRTMRPLVHLYPRNDGNYTLPT